MQACACVCMRACVSVCMRECVCVCMHACVSVCMRVWVWERERRKRSACLTHSCRQRVEPDRLHTINPPDLQATCLSVCVRANPCRTRLLAHQSRQWAARGCVSVGETISRMRATHAPLSFSTLAAILAVGLHCGGNECQENFLPLMQWCCGCLHIYSLAPHICHHSTVEVSGWYRHFNLHHRVL